MDILFVLIILIPLSTLATLIAWVGFYRDSKHAVRYAIFYLYGVFILSYSLVPDHALDLNRYWEKIETLNGLSLAGAVEALNDQLYVENVVFWLVGKLKMLHLLPAISTSIVYGVSTYIIVDSSKRMGHGINIFYVLLFQSLVFPYLSIVANVRNICAFAIGVSAVYRELVQKKRDIFTLSGYILPIFMHKTGLLILIVRLLIIIFRWHMAVAISIVLLLPTIISTAYANIRFIPGSGFLGILLRRLIASAYNYLIGGSEYAERLAQSRAYIVKYVAIVCIVMQAYLLFKHYRNHPEKEFSQMCVFSFLMSMIALATTVFDTPAYWRFGMACNISFFPTLLYYFNEGKNEFKVNGELIKWMFIVIAGLRFAIEAYRSIPRIDFSDTLDLLLSTNLYTIIINVFKGLLTM